jgi:Xaa-Pro aminopeptidase
MRQKGAEGAAFETIVASGARSAWPHARASSRRLRQGEFVILDLGAILAAYAADMTRTIYLGRPGRRARALYGSVVEAQREATENLRPGLRGSEADVVAREALKRHHLDQYFTHSTGHGVGLEVHERPRLARNDQTAIPSGSVVTVEPGVYVEGYGGVRIEDTVLVGEKGPEVLTPAPKEPWFTG